MSDDGGAVFDACLEPGCDEFDNGFFAGERNVRGRKRYECVECFAAIHPGKRHWHATGVSDGSWWGCRTCDSCHRVRESLFRDGWLAGELWESVREAFCHEPGDEEAMLPESYLHPVRYRCRTEHVQDCGHCDEWWCGDNTTPGAERYRADHPEEDPRNA